MDLKLRIALGIAAASIVAEIFVLNSDKQDEPFLTKINPAQVIERMRKQEVKLGIKHVGTPNVYTGRLPPFTDGEYIEEKEAIVLPRGNRALPNIDHELGHFYEDMLYKIITGKHFTRSNFDNNHKEGFKVICEGIARYFERTMNPETITEFRLPMKIDGKNMNDEYEGGYTLVKPIISKYGKKGIEYLITHIPSNEELTNVPDYQRKSLESLSRN